MLISNDKENSEKIMEIALKIRNTDTIIRNHTKNWPDYTRVILLGRTGVAKSSIANAIIGKHLQVKKNQNNRIHLVSTNSPFQIGDDWTSETLIPNIYNYTRHKLLICDSPGFEDSRGEKEEIINSFAIDQLFEGNCKIKILFVISTSQIESNRGINVLRDFERILQIIPDEKILKKCIGLVISNGNNIDPKIYLKELIDGNPNEKLVNWCKFFIENSNERLFSFPKATEKQVGYFYHFLDRSKLLTFCTTKPVINPCHKIVLNDKSIILVNKISNKFGTIELMIIDLINECRKEYQFQAINELEKWKQSFINILNNLNRVYKLEDLILLLNLNIKHSCKVDEKIKKIKYYESLVRLMNQIDNFKKIESDYIRKRTYYLFKQEIDSIKNKIQYKKNIFRIYENEKKTKEMSYMILFLKDEIAELNNNVDWYQRKIKHLQNRYNKQTLIINNLINYLYTIEIRGTEISNEIIKKQNKIARLKHQIEEHART